MTLLRCLTWPWLIGALAAVPFVVSMVASLVTGSGSFLMGDGPVPELHVRSATEGQLVMGPYSRFGWHLF